jgi:kinesin family protein 14
MTTKKVNFRKEVSKVSIGGTPRLSVLNNNDENEAPVLATPKSKSNSITSRLLYNNTKGEHDNLITVGIRIRPLSKKEIIQGQKNIIQVSDNYKKIAINDPASKQLHQFESDICFTDNNSSQANVFDCIGTPLISRAFEGFNVSLFAYGQTGSGKTYSMIGSPQDEGIIPRFIKSLFHKISTQKDAKTQFQCEISYYEIYNEKVYDLLNRSSNETGQQQQMNNRFSNLNNDQIRTNLKVREDPDTGPYIENLLKISCENANDVLLWFDIGNKRRATACTNTNDKSSRSHSIFQINLKQIKNESDGVDVSSKSKLQILTSKINLIDLAGSERINNLQNHHQQHSSSRFKESTSINKSLLTLGKIICILSERSQNLIHLPYRESELTWLLKESLGGNAKTAMLATIHPSSQFLDETLSTLRYATKTACIKNSAMLNRGDLKYDLNELDALKEEKSKLLKEMEIEYNLRLDEAKRLKEAELENLEKSLIIRNEEEKCSKNCCLINLNEDPLLSEKLIYLIKSSSKNEVTIIGSNKQTVDIFIHGPLIAPNHA